MPTPVAIAHKTDNLLWLEISRSQSVRMGLAIFAIFLFIALGAEYLAPYDPLRTSTSTLLSPSSRHPLGTDDLGRDVLSGIIYGTRTSLATSFLVTALSSGIALMIGLTAGYRGGITDNLLMRLTELFLVPPRFFLAVVIVATLGASFTITVLTLSLTFWPGMARLVRAEVLALRQRGYVEAAQLAGAGAGRILWREILPNITPIVLTNATLKLGAVILVEAALDFVGLGDPQTISWGYMLHNGNHFLRDAWWMALFPSVALALLLISLFLIGEGITRSISPQSRWLDSR